MAKRPVFKNLALASMTGAVYAVFVPLSSLLLLAPSEYGRFSVVYLTYAFSVSLQLSIILDPWARARLRDSSHVSWGAFSGAQTWLSMLSFIASFSAGMIIGFSPWVSLGMALGTTGQLRYFAARYYHLATKQYRRTIVADVLGLLFGIFALILIFIDLSRLEVVTTAWMAMGIVGATSFGLHFPQRGENLRTWVSQHRRTIKSLLADSLVMDASAIGVPMTLAGFLPVAHFGIYRAVSSVAMPVRLALSPLRASLTNWPLKFWRGRRGLVAAILPAVIFGLLCYVALVLTGEYVGAYFPTLGGLLPYAIPTSIFVAANYVGQLYYMISRIHNKPQTTLRCRGVQTLLTVCGPFLGLALDGLNGAIWGFSISYALAAFVWALSVFRH